MFLELGIRIFSIILTFSFLLRLYEIFNFKTEIKVEIPFFMQIPKKK